MLKFLVDIDPETGEQVLKTPLTGKPLMTTPQLNKGTAFTQEERKAFGLLGKLPSRIETLDEQVQRVFHQYQSYDTNLERYIYLNNLHDTNQVLFYRLVVEHLDTLMPIIYTPTVGLAVKAFSRKFRRSRGLYISMDLEDSIDEILKNRSNPDIDIIVVTDGEGVLGIGDQGIGAIDIPIAKLMVYSLCGGIDPCRTLPICLDTGTNNHELLADPMYLGIRKPRPDKEAYDRFIESFVSSVERNFPDVFLHWEDLGKQNGRRVLSHYRDRLCTFNDDIQGTGSVALAAILAGMKHLKKPVTEQRFVIFGAGTAGLGITHQIYDALLRDGLSAEAARKCFWLIDRNGLLTTQSPDLHPEQQEFARSPDELKSWQGINGSYDLGEVIRQVHPTILIGCSGVPGSFQEPHIREMCHNCPHPLIMPLSNPTELCEATPEQLITWSEGKALIATGSPFADVRWQGQTHAIPQCNNALVFPGLGLGVSLVKSTRITSDMMWVATLALRDCAPVLMGHSNGLLPSLKSAQATARSIAKAVAEEAIRAGLARKPERLSQLNQFFWQPRYLPFRLDPELE